MPKNKIVKATRLVVLLLCAGVLASCAMRPPRVVLETRTPWPTPRPTDFILESPAVQDGVLPKMYTCDGAAVTLPLRWRNASPSAVEFAVVMHHVPGPGDAHWYWVLYRIPADVNSLAENSAGVGVLGTNSVNDRTEYAPPCSKGPGPKEYIYTVYALDASPQFEVAPEQVDRDALLAAMSGHVLASAQFAVTYSR